jgi:2-octaprenylphenol hydroxylase
MSAARPTTVLIAGGGAIGLTVAALLATGRCADRVHVRVLEAGQMPRWDPARVDLRVYALSRAAQRILDRLRIWQPLAASRACAYRRMHVWEGGNPNGPASLAFDSADLGEPDLGHIVEDGLLRGRLVELVESLPNADIATDAALESIAIGERAVTVTLRNGASVAGNLLIGADGTQSAVRGLLDLAVTERSYEQMALVTHVASSLGHRETAWQRFLPSGPLAFLPLADGASAVVWSLPSERAEALHGGRDEDLVAALQSASAGVLGELSLAGPRAAFKLQALHAWQYCRSRVALLGDAAHTVHPLAGQGMNLGLLDAEAFADVFDAALLRGEDPGDLRVLRRYERERKGDNLSMLLALDALERLFALPAWVAPWRGVGLDLVDRAGPVKRALMRSALGLNSRRKNLLPWSQRYSEHRIGTP